MLSWVRPNRPEWVRVAVLALAIAFASAMPAAAQSYSKLQVLLPGESPAPGTATGKSGIPDDQVVGLPFNITVRACDATWNTVTSITHLVAITSTDDTASLPSNSNLTAGTRTFTVTLNAAGQFTFTADDQTDGTIPNATSAAVVGASLAGFEFDRITQKNQYAGVAMSVAVTAVNPTDDRVYGFNGPVRLRELTSFGEGRIVPEMVTLVDGRWSGNVTNYRADETSINRGNVNIQASLDSNPSINGLSDPFTVHPGNFSRVQLVVPGQDPLPGSVTGVTGSPASQASGQAFQVEVYATDNYWNPLPSADNVRITSSDAGASTPVSGNMSGGYRAFTLSLATVGSQTLTVTDQTNGSITGMTSPPIAVGTSSADHFEINAFSTSVTAGSPVAMTIRATDVGGNTITDFFGDAIIIPNTGATSVSPSSIAFVNGVWTGDMTFFGAGGSVSFTVSDFSAPPHTGNSGSFEVLPGPYVGLQVLPAGQSPAGGTAAGYIGVPSDQAAGSSFSVTVRAVDEWFNRVPAVNNQVELTSSDPFLNAPNPVTLTSGEATVSATLFAAGLQTITATDLDDSGSAAGTSSSIPVSAGPYTKLVLIAPGETLAPGSAEGRSGTATDQSINFAFTVKVYATDAWFNRITGVTDLVRITSGDPLAELPPDTQMVDGLATMSMRLSTGGFQQITASNVSQPGMAVSTTQVRAISSGFHLEAEVSPTSLQAGEPFTLLVKVTNDAGSVIQEINSTVSIVVQNSSTQDPGFGTLLNTEFQLLQGQRSVQETYTGAESIVLVVTDDAGNVPAVTEVIHVSPGPPTELRLSADPSWIRGNRHGTVFANVVDAYDNGVPAQSVTFSLLEGDGILTPIDSGTDAQGLARADFLSPRNPSMTTVRAVSNALNDEFVIETALVDPNEPAGTVTSYPNPFHPGESPATIAYKISADAFVKIKIYTLMGVQIREDTFELGSTGGREGLNEFLWDGRNGSGEFVSSGGYLVVIEAEGDGETLHVMRRRVGVVR
jgi:hypothetical protein